MTIHPHDFSRAPSLHPETRTKLVQWLRRSNSQLAEVIAGYGLQVEIAFDECLTAWPIDSLPAWPEKTVAFRVKLPDVAADSVIAMPSPLAQILIGTLLGEEPTAWPEERDLTPGEQSVGEFLMTMITSSMNDAWSGDAMIELQLGECEQSLRRTKIFKFREPFIVCRSTIKTAFGAAQWSWILPHDFLSKLFGSTRAVEVNSGVSTREQLESLARDMSTQVTIKLGGVMLSAPQIAELRVGDLIVLGQKTTDPLRAMVSGKPRFLGWPGRVGNRQAFEISSDGSRRDRTAEAANANGVATNR